MISLNEPQSHTERVSTHELDRLNEVFAPLPYHQRLQRLYHYFDEDEILVTSSFGTSSAFLLHLISRYHATQPIHFIDTRYHFAETLQYKQKLAYDFGLKVVNIMPHESSTTFTSTEKTWENDPNLCCTLQKVLPLEEYKARHNLWISGLMRFQNDYRKSLNVFERQGDIIKFYPLIDISREELRMYSSYFNLPEHPLLSQGYSSVGCMHCTTKGEGREGRWKGHNKTECGIHAPKRRFNSAKRL